MDYIRFISVITLTGIWIPIMPQLNLKRRACKSAQAPELCRLEGGGGGWSQEVRPVQMVPGVSEEQLSRCRGPSSRAGQDLREGTQGGCLGPACRSWCRGSPLACRKETGTGASLKAGTGKGQGATTVSSVPGIPHRKRSPQDILVCQAVPCRCPGRPGHV